MSRKNDILAYLKVAGEMALRGDPKRVHFLGAVGVRSDGAMVKALNGSTRFPLKAGHAEIRLARKLDVGSTVYVARITRRGLAANARPCPACMNVLKARGVKRVFYTIGPDEFGRRDF